MARQQKPTIAVGVPVPPPDPRPYVPGITLPANREVSFLCLHDSVLGYPIHWFDKQSFPCPRDKSWCAGCKVGDTARWTGFIGVISVQSNNRFIARIPMAAFRESGLFKDKSDSKMLAGCVFTSWRFGQRAAKTNPVVIEMIENVGIYPRCKPFPLPAALARWWRVDSLDAFDALPCPEKNPLPEGLKGISEKQWETFRAACKGGKKP